MLPPVIRFNWLALLVFSAYSFGLCSGAEGTYHDTNGSSLLASPPNQVQSSTTDTIQANALPDPHPHKYKDHHVFARDASVFENTLLENVVSFDEKCGCSVTSFLPSILSTPSDDISTLRASANGEDTLTAIPYAGSTSTAAESPTQSSLTQAVSAQSSSSAELNPSGSQSMSVVGPGSTVSASSLATTTIYNSSNSLIAGLSNQETSTSPDSVLAAEPFTQSEQHLSPSLPESSTSDSVPHSEAPVLMTMTQTMPNIVTLDGTTSVTMVIITIVTTLFNPSTLSTTTSLTVFPFSMITESITLSTPESLSDDTLSISSVSTGNLPSSSDVNLGQVSTGPSPVISLSSSPQQVTSSTSILVPPAHISQSFGFSASSCDGGVPPWCAYPTSLTSTSEFGVSTSAPAGRSFCACPACLMAPSLCDLSKPTQTTSCPNGWLCTLSIPYPTSTAWFSVGPGLEWPTKVPTWSIYPQTLTNRKTSSTTGLSWIATLSTSTSKGTDGSQTLYPVRVWKCVGPLCDPSLGLGWLEEIVCLIKLLCKPFEGIGDWSPPPVPVEPPIGPPGLDGDLEPTTIQASEKPDSTDQTTLSSSRVSTTTSCSASAVTSCKDVCFTQAASTTLLETCTKSCMTTAVCSSTIMDTTSTTPCTNTITLKSLVCSNTLVFGQVFTACETALTTTTGCQSSTMTSSVACSLNQGPIDPNLSSILKSWAAQYPFDPADLTLTSSLNSLASPGSTTSIITLTTSAQISCLGSTCISSNQPTSKHPVGSPPSQLSPPDPSTLTSQSLESIASASSASAVSSIGSAFGASLASIKSASEASASSASSASTQASADAAAASSLANQYAFSLPYTMEMARNTPYCVQFDKGQGPTNWPADSKYFWFVAGADVGTAVDLFCEHIGESGRLGGQYYVYSSAETGFDIHTQSGYNLTFSVTWNRDACWSPGSADQITKCAGSKRSKAKWWECPPENLDDGAMTFAPWPKLQGEPSQAFCKDSFMQAVYHCGSKDPKELASIGGWYFTPCLQWGIFSNATSPTTVWPLQGNGSEDMSWLAKDPALRATGSGFLTRR